MPLVQTRGAASAQGFGEFAQATVANYIEEVFSTYLYTGNGSTGQSINNGINLSGKGGLVWTKNRGAAANHSLVDTVRVNSTYNPRLSSNSSAAQVLVTIGYDVTGYTTTGYTLGAPWDSSVNGNTQSYVSWTFREQPKFFDIVTYTGNGSSQTINHNLGSVPGVMIVKSTTYIDNWAVYHRSLGATKYIELNNTDAASTGIGSRWDAEPTSTSFSVGYNGSVNASGETYVAYLFAHNAGGFGLTGTDNVISCGSYTGNGSTSGPTINLGYEPQWLLVKNATTVGNWFLMDNMRGIPMTGDTAILKPNTTAAEDNNQGHAIELNATGFQVTTSFTGTNGSGDTLIYIAIRRGPMKVPTLGTSVFSPNYQNVSTGTAITTNFPPDLQLYRSTAQVANEGVAVDRLRGVNSTTTANSTPWLDTTTTAAEASASSVTRSWGNTGFQMPSFVATVPSVFYSFRRAPSFFDEVCYTGTGSATTQAHNLGVVPELMIVKRRTNNDGAGFWAVYSAPTGATKFLTLNATSAENTNSTFWNNTSPTSSVFTVGTITRVNGSGETYVAYLFATCAGVSKVGSYTGTAATLQIDCGFTAGARFVLIKRTDSTGDWYVWDTARGIVSGNDPYLLLNSTAAEVTSTDYIDTYSAGFEISSTAPAAINASGGTYIFLAIA